MVARRPERTVIPQPFDVLSLLDKRSNEFQAVTAWQQQLIQYLGEPLDPITATLVEEATRLKLYLDRADRKALAARKPDLPSPRGDQRPGLRRALSGIMKTLRVDRAEYGRTPSPRIAASGGAASTPRIRPTCLALIGPMASGRPPA